MNGVLRHVQHVRQNRTIKVRHLGRSPHRQGASSRVVLSHQAPSFQGIAGVSMHRQGLSAGVVGFAPSTVEIANRHRVAMSQVGCLRLVQNHVVPQCLMHIDERRQRLVVHVDGVEGILGNVPITGYHHSHRLTHITHFILRQRTL